VNRNPITVTSDFTDAEILRLMTARGVTQVPVIRPDGSVARVASQVELLRQNLVTNRAVIMAGGEGRRLRPITEDVPKALVVINGKSLLEHLIERLRGFGILDLTICVRHRAADIRSAIGRGERWHVNIEYVQEAEPLGTAGALSLLTEAPNEPFFVMNCDVVSDADLVQMHRFHGLNGSHLTVAVTDHELEVPYGVVELDHERVVRLAEKPKLKFAVNAGIYLMDPEIQRTIPRNEHFDMPELITATLNSGRRVCSYPIRSLWLDVGNPENLRRAEQLVRNL
jgi:NDP-sugar pyrophosphorylase family protein